MTIQYKNQGFKQASTGKTTVLTCPTNATIIVKSMPDSDWPVKICCRAAMIALPNYSGVD